MYPQLFCANQAETDLPLQDVHAVVSRKACVRVCELRLQAAAADSQRILGRLIVMPYSVSEKSLHDKYAKNN